MALFLVDSLAVAVEPTSALYEIRPVSEISENDLTLMFVHKAT